MRCKNFIGSFLLTVSVLLSGSQALATVWTDHYDASKGYSFAGEGVSTITFDDWGYTGPGGRNAKDFAPINGFGTLGQRQHVATLWPDRLTPDRPQTILHDMTSTPAYTNANLDAQVNFYYWGYTSPGFDLQSDYTAYKAGDYSASTRQGSLFNNMLIDLDGDYLVSKNDMHFGYYNVFSYVDATGVNPSQDVVNTLSFQPYPVSDAIGWCGSVLASHPAALEVMAGQLTFDFAFDVYNGTNRAFMGTQIVPRFEMRSYGTLTVNVWAGSDLQTFTSNAVVNNTNPGNTDRWDVDPNYYSRVSFHGGGVLPDGAWVSADSYNPDGSRNLNPNGTWNVTVVPPGTARAIWYANAFAGYAFILRADGIRLLDWFNEAVYGPDPCTNKNCDDGNVCTTDSCVGGVCVHKPVSCPTGQACNPATGACAPFDFCANVVCNNNNACTTDTCNPATGCVYTPIVCNDNNACTTDACNPATGCVSTPVDCNDNNACTTDSCDPATGCVHTPTVVCNDNNPCTIDSCNPSTGTCVFAPINCDDGNACTTDSCDPATGSCVHTPTNACSTVDTTNNNFTMNQSDGLAFGGANDVHFTWDGTRKTSVAASGQVSNATLSSTCKFSGYLWNAHDVAIYGPGTYTVYADCPSGSPGCGAGVPITFTVNAGEIGGHMLFNWGVNSNIDVVNVWKKGTFAQGVDPSVAFYDPNGDGIIDPIPLWTGACGSNPDSKVWDWMSYDWDGDGINGGAMVDGPFQGMTANFNMMGVVDLCAGVVCNDNNACTTDTCDPATGCVFTPIVCNDNNACTADSCNPAAGCVFTPIVCNDNNLCTTDTCDPATGCVFTPIVCNDNNGCTTDSCNPAAGCVFTPIVCNDNNLCTIDTCNPAAGCVYTPAVIDDNNACTTDACDPLTGVITHTPIICNDNNACTVDSCDPATGCVFTPIVCSDSNLCTTDTCNPATGCVFTPIRCPLGYVCDPATGNCVNQDPCAGVVCNDNNPCTTDTCNPTVGCVYTLVSDGTVCTVNSQPGTCTAGQCIVSPICPAGSVKSVTIRGGGQKPGTVDLQIQTNFTVVNDGCIVGSTASTVTVTPGTVLQFDCTRGEGPQPSAGTWLGVPLATDASHTIVCPAASGDVGKLVLDNKANGGRDTDRITISVQ